MELLALGRQEREREEEEIQILRERRVSSPLVCCPPCLSIHLSILLSFLSLSISSPLAVAHSHRGGFDFQGWKTRLARQVFKAFFLFQVVHSSCKAAVDHAEQLALGLGC